MPPDFNEGAQEMWPFTRDKLVVPGPGECLPGRIEAMPVPERHFVSGRPLVVPYPEGLEKAVFGLGCFWGAERVFWQAPGVWVTAVGYALIPILEEKARDAGQPPPPSPWRDSLRNDGWIWLLWELGAMILFGLLSMGLDRLRRLQKERAEATIPPGKARDEG